MQTTNAAGSERLVEEALDLEVAPADAVRFVEVDFREADLPIRETDRRGTLELSPSTLAMSLP